MRYRSIWVLSAALLSACASDTPESSQEATAAAEQPAAATDTLAAQDSAIFAQRIATARQERWDTLPIGEVIARVGRTFVGAPYVPGTLEAPGAEQLVVNLRTFDCVTFVENSMAIARAIKSGQPTFSAYKGELQKIRYRGGQLDGYISRLHYFSEWIADNEAKGVVRNITRDLGGTRDPRPIDFMSNHTDAYRQMKDAGVPEQIRAMEARLTAVPRYFIPEDKIAAAAKGIQNGDVIAAVSTIPGLDIAHTGLALWVDGKLHLMHAPLVGKSVEISVNPLADRIIAQDKQNGIMAARPIEP